MRRAERVNQLHLAAAVLSSAQSGPRRAGDGAALERAVATLEQKTHLVRRPAQLASELTMAHTTSPITSAQHALTSARPLRAPAAGRP